MADEKKNGKPGKPGKPSIFARFGKWWRELKAEVRKIVWPTRQQTLNNVLVVIAAVLIVGVFVWVLDLVFGGVVAAVIGMLGG